MKIANYLALPALALGLVFGTSFCSKDDDNNNLAPTMKKTTFEYEFNNGQVVLKIASKSVMRFFNRKESNCLASL